MTTIERLEELVREAREAKEAHAAARQGPPTDDPDVVYRLRKTDEDLDDAEAQLRDEARALLPELLAVAKAARALDAQARYLAKHTTHLLAEVKRLRALPVIERCWDCRHGERHLKETVCDHPESPHRGRCTSNAYPPPSWCPFSLRHGADR